MKDDILAGITHTELKPADKTKFQSMMATATLIVENIARKPGMDWDRRDAYRKMILGQPGDSLTKHEIAVCLAVSGAERSAILEVEAEVFHGLALQFGSDPGVQVVGKISNSLS
jgi:hypothetical protein